MISTKGQREDHRKVDSSSSSSSSSSSEKKEDENKNFENNENNLGVEDNVEKEEETSNDANVVLDPAEVNKEEDNKEEGKNEAEENKKLTSLFKEISARRRQEILAAMTDFAKTDAEKNGETFADVRPSSRKTPAL